jgi:hypothetical protein
MLRKALVGAVAMLFLAAIALADDQKKEDKAKADEGKEVKANLVKVDTEKNQITVKTTEGKEKEFDVAKETKIVIGPKGTPASKAGLKDRNLRKGASLILVFADDEKTLKEVRLATFRGPQKPATGAKAAPDK